ncbi:hypothetical protein Taro_029354 [Colocasia esculenta]|uniref:Uncharacterized protein n=1 Tax=Colocasia esculenta TaxID=4460 RepID=A0A843VJM6_COLES|nr:hypothetical protein [Colocasia esculenta]
MNGAVPIDVLKNKLFATDVSRGHIRLLLTGGAEDKGKCRDEDDRERGPRNLLDTQTADEKAVAGTEAALPVLLLDRWGNEHSGNNLRLRRVGGDNTRRPRERRRQQLQQDDSIRKKTQRKRKSPDDDGMGGRVHEKN